MQDFERIRSFIQSFGKDEEGLTGEIYRDAVSRGVPVIRPDMKELLRLLLLMQKPERILEIGTAVGYSSLFMATVLPEARITTLEMDPERVTEARENIQRAGEERRIRACEGDAAELLTEMNAEISAEKTGCGTEAQGKAGKTETGGCEKNGKILHGASGAAQDVGARGERGLYDFVFIDAAKAQYGEYLSLVIPLVRPGAVIVSDNVLQDGSILESHFLVEKRDRTIHDRMREYLKRLTDSEEFTTTILPVGDGVAVTVYRPEQG